MFDEENPLYDDFYFMGKVLNIINSFIEFDTFKYVKVKHNDPINDPSLSQIECDDRWNQMLNSFIKTADLINANNLKDCIIIHSIKKSISIFIMLLLTITSVVVSKVKSWIS